MRIALIDDESAVRETVKTILQHYRDDLDIEEAVGVSSGIQLINSFAPELIFLDVEMGDGTGFDLLTRLQEPAGFVVFVTAHEHYAIKAFKFSALDYVLKPVDPKEIMSVLEKAERSIREQHYAKVKALLHNQNLSKQDKIVLSDHANIHLLDVQEIVACQAVGNYTHFFLTQGREIVISKTLKHYDELLADHQFIRIHQSYLINLTHLDRYDKREGGEVVMKDGRTIPVASRKKDLLIDVLKRFRR